MIKHDTFVIIKTFFYERDREKAKRRKDGKFYLMTLIVLQIKFIAVAR